MGIGFSENIRVRRDSKLLTNHLDKEKSKEWDKQKGLCVHGPGVALHGVDVTVYAFINSLEKVL